MINVNDIESMTWQAKESAAKNSSTSSEMLERLAEDKYSEVRAAVAANPNTPSEVLEKLAEDVDWFVRAAVAVNLNMPSELLERLAEDKYSDVREVVAANLNTSSEALEKLAKDKDRYVREAVAANLNTSSEVLERLAEDKYSEVRAAVAANSNTPSEALERLAEDEDIVEAYTRLEKTKVEMVIDKSSITSLSTREMEICFNDDTGSKVYVELPRDRLVFRSNKFIMPISNVDVFKAHHEKKGSFTITGAVVRKLSGPIADKKATTGMVKDSNSIKK